MPASASRSVTGSLRFEVKRKYMETDNNGAKLKYSKNMCYAGMESADLGSRLSVSIWRN